MSYSGRIHDALWEYCEKHLSDIPWRRRSEMIEEIITVVLPIFERTVKLQERRLIAGQLGAAFLQFLENEEAPESPPAQLELG